MPLVAFGELMTEAARGHYAVGYFESWNLESLMAVADAAEAVHSPVLLGFSGIYLPHPERVVREPLSAYAAMGLESCRSLSVPSALVFNESPHLEPVLEAIDLGFGLVMFSDENLDLTSQTSRVAQVVKAAHRQRVAVEGEVAALPGIGGGLAEAVEEEMHLTDLDSARDFLDQTGVDALAVNVGQVHLHGRREVGLDLAHLEALNRALPVPLVLHGATSVRRQDLVEAIQLGVCKINVGSLLKQVYLQALRRACAAVEEPSSNPYEVVGSGLAADVLIPGRLAVQHAVEELMVLFGSAGK